ncbi:ATP-binding protein [Candidatus Magnetobacterium casense]|uniref:ATP-binding protein n=1 Tax=Candidatus Magnetobacterium casense TaxID=1455061 RepID=A0ABS6RVE8_9BACT|nr:ATP-binding protein [Candidatus Magnetobacterium casensis]MBV6340602.1 ATP-binding protein [Candidatus Magnetobacterium casensis]
MIEPNWDIFKAKFNKKESAFEWLCYLLFCKEFNRNIGIAGYKNHAGIEKSPICEDGEWIGFQAKFYETALSTNKDNFISSIEAAKSRHPELTKILFYIHKDFGQNPTGTGPKYKTEIETYAKSKGVSVEWRDEGFFKSPFVCEDNHRIAQHFFSFDKSIIDFINALSQHTESIIEQVHSEITFNGTKIKIDRTKIIEELIANLKASSIAALSGEAGVGKTALIKDFYRNVKDEKPFFVFRATEFNSSNVNQFFKCYGNFTLSDFIEAYQDEEEKYVVIDSAEKLLDIENKEIFEEFLYNIHKNKWKIIFTTRYVYLDDLKNQFIQVYKIKFQFLNITSFTSKELTEFSKVYNFNLPKDNNLCELLRNPFYLNEYLQNYDKMKDVTSNFDFKKHLWEKRILNSSYQKDNIHRQREKCFLEIARERANKGHFIVSAQGCEDKILKVLTSDEIIRYDSNVRGYFISHDIYEEWALYKIIERAFIHKEDTNSFYQEIGSALPIRRAFRNWLSEKILTDKQYVKHFIEDTIGDDKVESHWRDEVLVSILLSDYSEEIIALFEKELLEGEQELLLKIISLLRTACKEIDESIFDSLGLPKAQITALGTLFTKPKGKGWSRVIHFINAHKEKLGLKHIKTILPLINDWNNKNKQGKTTKDTSLIALFYHDELTKNDVVHYRSKSETATQIIPKLSDLHISMTFNSKK